MIKLVLPREKAVALFEALGTTTAEKWNNKRLAVKAAKVDEMIFDDTKLPKAVDATLTKVLEAIENGTEIEVVDAVEEAPAKKKPAKAAPAPVEEEAPKAKAKSKGKPTPAPVEEPVEEGGEEMTPEEALADLKIRYDNGEITAAEFKTGRKAIVAAKAAASKPAKPAKAEKPAKPVDFSKAKAEKPAKAAPAPVEEVTKIPRVRSTETRPFLAGQIIKEYGLEVGVTDEMIAELDRRYGTNKPRECAHILRHAWHSVRGFLSE